MHLLVCHYYGAHVLMDVFVYRYYSCTISGKWEILQYVLVDILEYYSHQEESREICMYM